MAWAEGTGGVQQAAAPSAPAPAGVSADGGFDFRLREENIDNIPGNAPGTVGPGGHQDYLRYRPRVWGQLSNEDFGLYTRVVDEWRHYWVPRNYKNYNWPDEIVLDNLYLDIKNVLSERVALRIGRQDLAYGAGRVIFEGTPGDGSRTLFFDAIKARVKLDDKSWLDVIGIYNNPETDLSVGNVNHELTQLSGKTKNGLIESGAGIVLNTRDLPELPMEAYYFWKHESSWEKSGVSQPGRDVHTVGSRFTPPFGKELEGDFEAALQLGQTEDDQSILAGMGYAGLTWKPPITKSAEPYLKGACYYLSGDNNSSDYPNGSRAARNDTYTAWDPIWARYPQLSELYVLAYNSQYGIGYWSNLVWPYLEAGCNIATLHKFSVKTGPMYAAEEDSPTGDNRRGWLSTARYDFPLIVSSKDAGTKLGRRLTVYGHLQAELFSPGDYYPYESNAYFLRWELDVRF